MSEAKIRQRGAPRAMDTETSEPKTVETLEGFVTVTRANYNMGQQMGDTEEFSEKVDVPIFKTQPAYVKTEGSITRNIGDFNSVRVSCSVSLPAYPNMSEVNRVFNLAEKIVEDRVNKTLNKAVAEQTQVANYSQ